VTRDDPIEIPSADRRDVSLHCAVRFEEKERPSAELTRWWPTKR
jgi:hypothetical protein